MKQQKLDPEVFVDITCRKIVKNIMKAGLIEEKNGETIYRCNGKSFTTLHRNDAKFGEIVTTAVTRCLKCNSTMGTKVIDTKRIKREDNQTVLSDLKKEEIKRDEDKKRSRLLEIKKSLKAKPSQQQG